MDGVSLDDRALDEVGCGSLTGAAQLVFLGIGSNLGDRLAAMRAAVLALAGQPSIRLDLDSGVASLYETSPVGGPLHQPAYLNSAVRVWTELPPLAVLYTLHAVEAGLGRTRRERWEPRVIDIDLLLYGDAVIDASALTVPHPRLHERGFVLVPLMEIAGGVVHPGLAMTIRELHGQWALGKPTGSVARVAGPGWVSDGATALSPTAPQGGRLGGAARVESSESPRTPV